MSAIDIRKFVIPEILFGAGSRKLAGKYSKNLGVSKALIVTDLGVVKAGLLESVIESLNEQNISYSIYQSVSPNPRDFEVMNGAQIYESEKCNGIIAVGGGSPMDCAKGIGIVSVNKKNILNFSGVDKISSPMPPLICIPTTAGSSSDVSQFSIILDSEQKVKIAIISKAIVPDVSLVDPETTYTMDPGLVSATGMDALVHAIEAFVSKGRSSMTDIHSIEAIKLIVKYLQSRYNNPNDLESMEKMMMASMVAGLAFSNAILGAVHSMAHSLGGFLDLPHGECNAILLDSVIGFNYDSEPERFDAIAEIFGLKFKNETKKERKNALMKRISEFKESLGITNKLHDIGVKSSDIPILAKKAHNDPCLLTNPKKISKRDIEVIYEETM